MAGIGLLDGIHGEGTDGIGHRIGGLGIGHEFRSCPWEITEEKRRKTGLFLGAALA
jgi:hypothetical protein